MPRSLTAAFAALALYIGLAYYLGTPERTMGPTYAPAKAIVPAWVPLQPMQVWGLLFMAGFGAILIGIVVARPKVTELTLFVGGGIYVWWATLLGIACVIDPTAPASAPGVYAFIAFSHYVASWRVHMDRREPVSWP